MSQMAKKNIRVRSGHLLTSFDSKMTSFKIYTIYICMYTHVFGIQSPYTWWANLKFYTLKNYMRSSLITLYTVWGWPESLTPCTACVQYKIIQNMRNTWAFWPVPAKWHDNAQIFFDGKLAHFLKINFAFKKWACFVLQTAVLLMALKSLSIFSEFSMKMWAQTWRHLKILN